MHNIDTALLSFSFDVDFDYVAIQSIFVRISPFDGDNLSAKFLGEPAPVKFGLQIRGHIGENESEKRSRKNQGKTLAANATVNNSFVKEKIRS